MKIIKGIKIIKKQLPINQDSPARLRLFVVFMAGMVMTAVLAHTQVAADMLSPRPIDEPIMPVVPVEPDLIMPGTDCDTGKLVIVELV